MKKPAVISVINHKGGTGKTTTTFNLAEAMSFIMNKKEKSPAKILLIDNDPQASLTNFFYDSDTDLEEDDTIIRIYKNIPDYNEEIILQTDNPDIHLVANMFFCTNYEYTLLNEIGIFRIKNFILKCASDYDIIMIDNAPKFDIFTRNALASSDHVLIPTELTRLSILGIKDIIGVLEALKVELNPLINVLGILINKLDERAKTHHVIKELLYKELGKNILTTEIHQAASLQNAERKKMSIVEYDKNTRAHKEFSQLARELLNKMDFDVDFNKEEAVSAKIGIEK